MVATVAPTGGLLNPAETMQVEAAAVNYTTTSSLNLRSGASTKHKIVTAIPKGKQVAYVSKSGTWFKVKYGSKTGYVSSKYLKKVTAKKASAPAIKYNTVYNTTDNLSLRSGGSIKHKKLLTIPKGKAVAMVTYSKSWSKVKYSNKTGYVSTKYLKSKKVAVKPAPKPVAKPKETKFSTKKYNTTTTVSVYSTYATSGKVLVKIPKGKAVSSNTKVNNWYKVTYSGKTGWIEGKKIKEVVVKPAAKPAVPAKDAYVSIKTVHKQLMAISSPGNSESKLFDNEGYSYGGTILPSSDAKLSARFGVAYVYADSAKATMLHINTQRYRDNKHLRDNGDAVILAATEAFFGKGKTGTKQLQDLIKANMYAKPKNSYIKKTMTFGGHKANVIIGEWDIEINFDMSVTYN